MKQTPGRKQFTFYRSYIENVMKLPKCRRFETLLGIIFYALDGTEPDLSGASDAVFGCIRPNIDSSRVKAETALRTREKAGAAEAEDELIRGEDRRELFDAMRDLPEDYRNALYLAYFEDMSHEDIARIMHKTKKQVYNLIFRGKQSLRGLLEDTELNEKH